MSKPRSEKSQIIFFASAWAVSNLLRENMIKPEYALKVTEMIEDWNSYVTDKKLLEVLEQINQEESEKLK